MGPVGAVIKSCVASGSGGNYNVNWFSCSVGQDGSSIQAMVEDIRNAICAYEHRPVIANTSVNANISVTVTLQEAAANMDICQTPVTTTITCSGSQTTYINCNSMPKYCFVRNETATCCDGNYYRKYTCQGIYPTAPPTLGYGWLLLEGTYGNCTN